MDRIQPLFSASATATGGRNGHTQTSDGTVRADLSVPISIAGPGKPDTATPEHLFAAGYGACFCGAMEYVARQRKMDAIGRAVTADVSIGARQPSGFALAVKLTAQVPNLSRADLEPLAREAHENICPYSHATRDNIDVTIEARGGQA